MSRMNQLQPQPVDSSYQPFHYPGSPPMILDIQPTGMTTEEQLIVGALEGQPGQLRPNEAQMYQGIEYVGTINLPPKDQLVTSQELQEPRQEVQESTNPGKEVQESDKSTSKKKGKTFRADEIAKIVIGGNLVGLDQNQILDGNKVKKPQNVTTDKPPEDTPTFQKQASEEPVLQEPPREQPTPGKPLPNEPPPEDSLRKKPVEKPPAREKPIAEATQSEKETETGKSVERDKEPISKPSQVQQLVSKPFQIEEPLSKPSQIEEPLSKPSQMEEPLSKPSQMEEPLSKPSQIEEPLSKSSQIEEPQVKHIYPRRNPHIGHRESTDFLGESSSSTDIMTENIAAPNSKKVAKAKKPTTGTRGKSQRKITQSTDTGKELQNKPVTRRETAKASEKIKEVGNTDQPKADEATSRPETRSYKETRTKPATRRETAKILEKTTEYSSTEQAKVDEATKKPETDVYNTSKPITRVGKDIGKTMDRASQLAVMKTVKEQMDAKKKVKKSGEIQTSTIEVTAEVHKTKTGSSGKSRDKKQKGSKMMPKSTKTLQVRSSDTSEDVEKQSVGTKSSTTEIGTNDDKQGKLIMLIRKEKQSNIEAAGAITDKADGSIESGTKFTIVKQSDKTHNTKAKADAKNGAVIEKKNTIGQTSKPDEKKGETNTGTDGNKSSKDIGGVIDKRETMSFQKRQDEIPGQNQEVKQTAGTGNIVYEFNEKDNEPKEGIGNYMTKRRTKRKRKQMKECIVHLHQLTPETLSTIYSTGSVTLTDDSSIASSEFSKTTDTRLGDDEEDNATDDGMMKSKKKRKREPKAYNNFTEVGKENPRRSSRKNPQHAGPNFLADTKPGSSTTQQGFKEVYNGKTQASMLKEKFSTYTTGPPEINNNTMKMVENPVPVPGGLQVGSRVGTQTIAVLNPDTRQYHTLETPVLIKKKAQKSKMKTSEVALAISRNGPSTAFSGSDSDSQVNPMRIDRGLYGRSCPEDWVYNPKSKALVPSVDKNCGLQTAAPNTAAPIPPVMSSATAAPVSGAPVVPFPAQKPQGAVQAALNSPPSPFQDGKPVWPRQTLVPKYPVSMSVAPSTATTAPAKSQPNSVLEALERGRPPASNVASSASSIETTVSRVAELNPVQLREGPTQSQETIPVKPAQPNPSMMTTQTVTSPTETHPIGLTGSVVRNTSPQQAMRTPQLLTARPYGQIQTTKPQGISLHARGAGIEQTPRFPRPVSVHVPVQQPRMMAGPVTASPIPPTVSSTTAKQTTAPISGVISGSSAPFGSLESSRVPKSKHHGPNIVTIPDSALNRHASARRSTLITTPQERFPGSTQSIASRVAQPRPSGSIQSRISGQPPPPQPARFGMMQPRPTYTSSQSVPRITGLSYASPGIRQVRSATIPQPSAIQRLQQPKPAITQTVAASLEPRPRATAPSQLQVSIVQQPTSMSQPVVSHPIPQLIFGPSQPVRQMVTGPRQQLQHRLLPSEGVQQLRPSKTPPPLKHLAGRHFPPRQSENDLGSTGLSANLSTTTVPSSSTQFAQPVSQSTVIYTRPPGGLDPRTAAGEFLRSLSVRHPAPEAMRQPASYPTTILMPARKDGQAPSHLIHHPTLPPNTVQIGPGPTVIAVPQGQGTISTKSLPPYLRPNVQQIVTSTQAPLAELARQLAINTSGEIQIVPSQITENQMAPRTTQVTASQMLGAEQSRPSGRLPGGRLETHHAPPPVYTSQPQPRGPTSSSIITAMPIRDGQVLPRTKHTQSRQTVMQYTSIPVSSTSQRTASSTGRDSIYENLSDISDDATSGNRKRSGDTESETTGVPPKKKSKVPKFKCKECDQNFNHIWLIEEHIRIFHKFKDVDSCIIQTSASTAKSVSSCSEPDTQNPMSMVVDKPDGNRSNEAVSKFKCKECNQNFNHKWLIEEHIQIFHKFKDVDSYIIQTSASTARNISSCIEPDVQNPVSMTVDEPDDYRPHEAGFVPPPVTASDVFGRNPESRREEPEETTIDLTTETELVIEPKGSESKTPEKHADPETKKIREILNKMGNEEIREMFKIAKNMRPHGDVPNLAEFLASNGSTSSVLNGPDTNKPRDTITSTSGAGAPPQLTTSVIPPSTAVPVHNSNVRNTRSPQINRNPVPSQHAQMSSTVTKQQQSATGQGPPIGTRPSPDTRLSTASGPPVTTPPSNTQKVPPTARQKRPIGLDRHKLIGSMLSGPIDSPVFSRQEMLLQQQQQQQPVQTRVVYSQQQFSNQQQQNREAQPGISADGQERLADDPKGISSTMQPEPQPSTSQGTQISGRPGNSKKPIGMDRHKFLATIVDPGTTDQLPRPKRDLKVVINYRVTTEVFHSRLNDLISITKPRDHGWDINEFEEKFTEYLAAPEDDFKVVKHVLEKKKMMPEQKYPSLDEFIRTVAADLDLEAKSQKELTSDKDKIHPTIVDESTASISKDRQLDSQDSSTTLIYRRSENQEKQIGSDESLLSRDRDPEEVLESEITSKEFHARLNAIVDITRPSSHGWTVKEFHEKFETYLRAPADEYQTVKEILQRKMVPEQKFPIIDELLKIVDADLTTEKQRKETTELESSKCTKGVTNLNQPEPDISQDSQPEVQQPSIIQDFGELGTAKKDVTKFIQPETSIPQDSQIEVQEPSTSPTSARTGTTKNPINLERHHIVNHAIGPKDFSQSMEKGFKVLMELDMKSIEFYSRQNDIVNITNPSIHGWSFQEFEEKFAKFLQFSEDEYKFFKEILRKKMMTEKRYPSLDVLIRAVEAELKAGKKSKDTEKFASAADITEVAILNQSEARISDASQSHVQVSTYQSQTTMAGPVVQLQTLPASISQSQSIMPESVHQSRPQATSIIQSLTSMTAAIQSPPPKDSGIPAVPLAQDQQQFNQGQAYFEAIQMKEQQQQEKQQQISQPGVEPPPYTSTKRQFSEKPGNPRKMIGLDRHTLVGSCGNFGSDELHAANKKGLNVVKKYKVSLEVFQLRLNDVICITQPNKHGWNVNEFQDKFTEYLTAPEAEYRIIRNILVNKKIHGQKYPSLDEFKRIVAEDKKEAKHTKQVEPDKSTLQVTTQDLTKASDAIQPEDVLPTYQSHARIPVAVVQNHPPPASIIHSMEAVPVQVPGIQPSPTHPRGDYHHPHSGQCTLLSHPPGESCPVNIWERYHELKGTRKPPESKSTHNCHVCGMEFPAFWRKETHLEEVHGIAMPTLPEKGVATCGTTDKLEELVSKRKTLKPRKLDPNDFDDYATDTSEYTKETSIPQTATSSEKNVISEFTENESNSKIPLSVIESPNAQPPAITTPPKKKASPKKSGIREVLFSSGSFTAVPNTSSSQALVTNPEVMAVTSTHSSSIVTPTPSTGTDVRHVRQPSSSLSTEQLSTLAHSLSSVITGQAVLGSAAVLTDSSSHEVVGQGPQVPQLHDSIKTVAATAVRRLSDPFTSEGAMLRSYTTPQYQTVVTSTQENTQAPIQSTIPITQTRPTNIELATAELNETRPGSVTSSELTIDLTQTSPVTNIPSVPASTAPASTAGNQLQTTSAGDPDIEILGSVETRLSGLKLLVPPEVPERKTKTVKYLLGLRDKKKSAAEARNETISTSGAGRNFNIGSVPTTSGASVFDRRVDKLVKEKRKRGRPARSSWTRMTASSTCDKCGKEQTNVRGQPHKCLVHACIHCNKSCDTAQQLMEHVKLVHPQKPVYECDICKKGFNIKGTLERHMFVHSKKKEYKCSICKLAFTQSNNLKRHIAIHTGQKAYKCDECDKAFTSKYNLSQHMLVHFPKRTTYTCRFCKKNFLFARTRDKHEFTHFGFTELQCSKCLKKFPSLKSLEAHIDIYHEGVGEAEGAYYEYATSDDAMSRTGSDVTMASKSSTLAASMETASEKTDGFSPKENRYIFTRNNTSSPGKEKKEAASSMTSNKKQRKHVCLVCNQTFFFLLHLQEHMQSHKDKDTNKYECTVCDKQFTNLDTFRVHRDIHSPLHCSECDESFRFDTQLAQHKLTEHRNVNGSTHEKDP